MFFATDIASFLACPHTATLARAELKNEIAKPFRQSAAVDLLRRLGLEHEQRYLRGLAEKDGLGITHIDVNGSWKNAVAETLRALHEGVDAVYQATFLDAPWGGRADFLVRVNRSSALGSWSYEVVETKLARSTKATALVQLCFYSDLLSRIQGLEPQWMHVVLGGAAIPERFQVQRYIAYFRKVRSEFEKTWKLETDTNRSSPVTSAAQPLTSIFYEKRLSLFGGGTSGNDFTSAPPAQPLSGQLRGRPSAWRLGTSRLRPWPRRLWLS